MSKIKFNKEQLEAISHNEGACAVIAGAGSGKSTVLVNRINKLVDEGVPEDLITAITFTDNSSQDLKKKLAKLNLNNVVVGTFHSICRRILLSEGISTNKMIKPYEVENEFKKIIEKPKMNDIMSFIGYQKNYGIGVDGDFKAKSSDYEEEELREFYKAYEDLKDRLGAKDFDDWLLIARDILRKKPKENEYVCDYILVDEHQDSNLIQNELIDLLCPNGNVFCVFDYRQAIYTFRGGNPEYCMNFKDKYPNAKVINLDVNYRSSEGIVEGANKFIENYYGNYNFYSDSKANSKDKGKIEIIDFIDKNEEAKSVVGQIMNDLKNGIKPNDIAVLYRMNQNSFEVEAELKRNNISYQTSAKNSFFKRREINLLVCMLRLIDNPDDDGAFEEIFRFRCHPFTFISNKVYENIVDLAARKNISLFEASEVSKTNKFWERRNLDEFRKIVLSLVLQNKRRTPLRHIVDNIISLLRLEEYMEDKYDGEELEERVASIESFKKFIRDNTVESLLKFVYMSNKSERKSSDKDIQLMTIHKSKGLEFKKTYVIGVQDGKFPHVNSPEIDEARLFYVGVTRAREELVISQIYQGNKFIDEYLGEII
ncbi:MAG: ATP-dependent helicase [Clostridium sp.]|uniref:ATP-dependent helicase n=1 Tax=Clostridium sp. TaxID=1506 RepID=UPI003EE78909